MIELAKTACIDRQWGGAAEAAQDKKRVREWRAHVVTLLSAFNGIRRNQSSCRSNIKSIKEQKKT